MKNKTKLNSNAGFSLLELGLVLFVISLLIGVLLPKGFDMIRNAKVQQVGQTVQTLKTAITELLTVTGTLPRTEGAGIPVSGTALAGASDTAKGNGARLDAILVSLGKIERPLSLRMGSQVASSTGTGNEMTWNQASQAFVMTPDAAPLKDWSAVTRVEARSANPALAPSVAQGANFRLDGTTAGIASTYVIAYLAIPGCAAKEAYELALALNGPQGAPVEGAACDAGVVAYAAPVNGTTDVYVYLTAL